MRAEAARKISKEKSVEKSAEKEARLRKVREEVVDTAIVRKANEGARSCYISCARLSDLESEIVADLRDDGYKVELMDKDLDLKIEW